MIGLASRTRAPPAIFVVAAVVLGWAGCSGGRGFRDSGELATAAFGLGVAHPTGFAVDMLLLRAAALFPLGTIAFRQNLRVALQAALALGLLAELCDRLARRIAWPMFARAGPARSAVRGAARLVDVPRHGAVRRGLLAGALAAAVRRGLCGARRPPAGAVCAVIGLALGLHVTAGLFALLGWPLRSARAVRGTRALRGRAPARAAGLGAGGALSAARLAARPGARLGRSRALRAAARPPHGVAHPRRYAGDMLVADGRASLQVLTQLLELWPLLALAVVGVGAGRRRAPFAVLLPLVVLGLDLAYAAWINPMGAADRQVGHVAGASLACWRAWARPGSGPAPRGRAWGCGRARPRPARSDAHCCCVLPRDELADPYAAAELLGSGGPLAALPPRTCSCAPRTTPARPGCSPCTSSACGPTSKCCRRSTCGTDGAAAAARRARGPRRRIRARPSSARRSRSGAARVGRRARAAPAAARDRRAAARRTATTARCSPPSRRRTFARTARCTARASPSAWRASIGCSRRAPHPGELRRRERICLVARLWCARRAGAPADPHALRALRTAVRLAPARAAARVTWAWRSTPRATPARPTCLPTRGCARRRGGPRRGSTWRA